MEIGDVVPCDKCGWPLVVVTEDMCEVCPSCTEQEILNELCGTPGLKTERFEVLPPPGEPVLYEVQNAANNWLLTKDKQSLITIVEKLIRRRENWKGRWREQLFNTAMLVDQHNTSAGQADTLRANLRHVMAQRTELEHKNRKLLRKCNRLKVELRRAKKAS